MPMVTCPSCGLANIIERQTCKRCHADLNIAKGSPRAATAAPPGQATPEPPAQHAAFCGMCGAKLTPTHRFCVSCGAPVVAHAAQDACPGCGQNVPHDGVLCPYCGDVLHAVIEEQTDKISQFGARMYTWIPGNKRMKLNRLEIDLERFVAHFEEGEPQEFYRGRYEAKADINQYNMRLIIIKTFDGRTIKMWEQCSAFDRDDWDTIMGILGVQVPGWQKAMLSVSKLLR